jgi:hypothetical protein
MKYHNEKIRSLLTMQIIYYSFLNNITIITFWWINLAGNVERIGKHRHRMKGIKLETKEGK